MRADKRDARKRAVILTQDNGFGDMTHDSAAERTSVSRGNRPRIEHRAGGSGRLFADTPDRRFEQVGLMQDAIGFVRERFSHSSGQQTQHVSVSRHRNPAE